MNSATTATLARKCIACGHDNAIGGESCSACGSSLDLKLCPACEAINGAATDRCHACGDVFVSAPAEAAIEGKVLTVFREPLYVWKSKSRRRKRFAMFLAVLAAMLSLPAYLLVSGIANRVAPAAVKEQQGPVAQQAQAAAPVSAKTSTAAAKTMETSASVVTAAQAAPAARPSSPVTSVTHTRRAEPPVAKTASAAAAALVVQPPPAEATATPVARPRARVTHTRATPADVAVPAAAVAGNVNPVSEPSASAGKRRSPDCDERLAALGFCNSKEKGQGN